MFSNATDGLLPVLNNHISNQQAQGMTEKQHNTLPKAILSSYLIMIFVILQTHYDTLIDYYYQRQYALQYGRRMCIYFLYLNFVMSKSKMKLSSFTRKVLVIQVVIEMWKGGINYTKWNPVQIPIFNRAFLGKRINLFNMNKHYVSIPPEIESDRIFLKFNRDEVNEEKVFKAHHFGKRLFYNAGENVCL